MSKAIRYQLAAFFSLLLLSTTSNAAIIKGRVTDENGEGLPFATVLEKGTTNGTSANGDGYYSLEIGEGSHTITAQFIGYKPESKSVNTNTDKGSVNFKLTPQSLEMSEVTIKANGEDPAYPIMRKVIEKRKYHADLVKSFETDVYLKGGLKILSMPKKIMGYKMEKEDYEGMGVDSTGKGIVYLLEQMSEYSYEAPSKYFTKVISIHESGDPKGVGFAQMPPVINIYENSFDILGGISKRGFISPANSNAFLYYKFKFLGSYVDGDIMINKIKVIPKRKFEPLFSGVVYVVDDEWVFSSVDLVLTKESQLDQLDTLKFKQTYVPLKKDLWIIQSQIIYPALKFAGVQIGGNFLTSYKNQKVNQPIDPKRFQGNVISTYDSTANDRNLAYWDSIRPVPLEADEVKDFIVKDSLYNAKLNDTSKKITHNKMGVGTFLWGNPSIKNGKNSFSMQPIISSVAYNTVEGINATLTLDWNHTINENKSYNLEMRNRYGFSNTHYNFLLKYSYSYKDEYWRGRNWKLSAYGGKYVYQLNNENPISPFLNELYTLFGGDNYMKLYEKTYGKIRIDRNWNNGFMAAGYISYEHRIPLENSTDYTFSESNKKDITPNNPSTLPTFETHNAAIIGAAISYQPGYKYIQYPKFKGTVIPNTPVFTATYTKGIPNIFDSKSDFDKWSVSVQHQLGLKLLGKLDYKLIAGGFLNDNYVGVPDMKHLFGNQTFIANPYLSSFQLAPYYRFSNTADIYGEGHVEWHLNGWLTNKIPLFRRLQWNLVGASNVLYIDNDNYYAEVSVGLENIGYKIFRFGRVDFVAGYESGKNDPYVGIKIGLGDALWQLAGISKGGGE